MSDLVRTQIVGFLTHRLDYNFLIPFFAAAVNALEIDWASLNRDNKPKPTTGSALQRFKPGNLFAKMGLSRQYAGEDLYKEVLSVCQRQEEAEAG